MQTWRPSRPPRGCSGWRAVCALGFLPPCRIKLDGLRTNVVRPYRLVKLESARRRVLRSYQLRHEYLPCQLINASDVDFVAGVPARHETQRSWVPSTEGLSYRLVKMRPSARPLCPSSRAVRSVATSYRPQSWGLRPTPSKSSGPAASSLSLASTSAQTV